MCWLLMVNIYQTLGLADYLKTLATPIENYNFGEGCKSK